MKVNKFTMRIEDPVMDEKFKKSLYDKMYKVIPSFIIYFSFFTILNIIKLIRGSDHAMYYFIRNIIIQLINIFAYYFCKRWPYLIIHFYVIQFSGIAIANVINLYSPSFHKTEEESENNATITYTNLHLLLLV